MSGLELTLGDMVRDAKSASATRFGSGPVMYEGSAWRVVLAPLDGVYTVRHYLRRLDSNGKRSHVDDFWKFVKLRGKNTPLPRRILGSSKNEGRLEGFKLLHFG